MDAAFDEAPVHTFSKIQLLCAADLRTSVLYAAADLRAEKPRDRAESGKRR